ncbi:MAG: choice-of-anchor tandem repeat GloVer-containing protein [Candidatus Cybelea sp.]
MLGQRRAVFRTLVNFIGTDGAHPRAAVVALDGVLYGTTSSGGKRKFCQGGCGVVFAVESSSQKRVYPFNWVDGANPYAGLTIAEGLQQRPQLFGTASDGGSGINKGTAIAMNPRSSFRVIHNFGSFEDGANPWAGLVQVKNFLYGTTGLGPGDNERDRGTVFQMTLNGQEHPIYAFHGPDGAFPRGNLAAFDGRLYGTTSDGGAQACKCGTIFEVNTTGGGQTLYSFGGRDGAHPYAGLTLWQGLLYGTTRDGGASGKGSVFVADPSNGQEHRLYSFSGPDGAHPYANLTMWHGLLYGTTRNGGAFGKGTIFQMAPSGGSERVLHSFGGPDGSHPYASLTVVHGAFYGTTYDGGTGDDGTIFELKMPAV